MTILPVSPAKNLRHGCGPVNPRPDTGPESRRAALAGSPSIVVPRSGAGSRYVLSMIFSENRYPLFGIML
jgi:hypothetical protein